MCKRLFLIILVFLTSSFLVKAQSDAPFLYYYERESNRFLIERADGQDRFVLVEDALPEDHELRAQGWSPSGRWFMWTASEYADYPYPSNQNFRAWMVSADGAETLPLLDDLDWTDTVAWSPVEDFLLVTRFEEPPIEGVGPIALYVIDVNAQQVIVHTELGESQGYSRIWWSIDGSHIFYESEHEMTRISVPTGKMDTIPDRPWWTSDRYGLWTDHENQIVKVTDLAGNILFEKSIPGVGVTYAEWNPQNTHALIFVSQGYMGPREDPVPPHDVWLLSMADQSLIHIIDNAAIPTVEPYGMSSDDYPLSIWTPEGNRALFPTRHRLLYWFNLDNNTIENTGLSVLSLSDIEEFYQLYTELGTQWTEHYGFIMWGEDIWVYDRETDQFLDTSFGIHANFGVSPNEHYVAQPGYVWDWEHNSETQLLGSISRSYQSEIIWHTTNPWVLIRWRIFWMVSNFDGTIQRYICFQDCIGWLPENVDTSHIPPQPAPPTVIPQMLLQSQSHIIALDWSPDGSTIASLGVDGEIRLWDANTGETIQAWYVEDMPKYTDLDLYYEYVDIVWGRDSQTLATVFRSPRYEEYTTATVRLWLSQTGEQLAMYEGTAVAFDLDQQYLLLVDAADNLMLWDMETHTTLSDQTAVLSIAQVHVFSPDGNPLFPEPEENLSLQDRLKNFSYSIDNVTVNPDGQYYVDGRYHLGANHTYPGGRFIRKIETGEVIARYTGFGYEAAWSPDSTRLAIAEEHLIRIWVVPE